MNLLPTDEQEEFASSTAAFLAASIPLPRIRELGAAPDNVDGGTWSACAELGWFGLGLAEAFGGAGAGLADEALLFRELGRSLAPGPFLGTVLGARVAALGGAEDLADAIVAGRQRVGLGIIDRPGDGRLLVVDPIAADHVLVVTPATAMLLDAHALGDLVDVECIDKTTRLRMVPIGSDVLPNVVAVDAAQDAVERRGLVLSAALLVGIAEAGRDIASEHAKTRVQFDQPIGSYQAVKHPCADMAVRAEAAWSQTVVAALAHDEGNGGAEAEALAARLVADDAAERNAAAAIQVLGGIGFTVEHEIHLYLTRTHVLRRCLADRATLLGRLVAS